MHSPKVQECFAKNFICTLSCVFSRLFPVYLLYNQQKGIQALWEPVLNSSIISSNRLYYYKDITKNDFLGDNFVSWKCPPQLWKQQNHTSSKHKEPQIFGPGLEFSSHSFRKTCYVFGFILSRVCGHWDKVFFQFFRQQNPVYVKGAVSCLFSLVFPQIC